jgi:hypothetical protein
MKELVMVDRKGWMIPGTYADRGDKCVEKDGQLVTDAEKGIKITEMGGRERYCYRCGEGVYDSSTG